MRLRHIEIFHAIYITGSITGAADLLYVSQPSVSKVLSHAEQQLGFALFHRNKGKLTPTKEADTLFPEINKIYQQLISVKQLTDNINKSDQGIVNIAVTPALGFDIVPSAITAFRASHPNVAFHFKTVHNQEALTSLLEHKCELAVLFSSPSLPGVHEQILFEQDMVVMYPKSWFSEQPAALSISDIADKEIIGIWESGPLGEMILRHIEQSGENISSSIQVDTYYIAANLVKAGLGCCVIDRFTAEGNCSAETGIAAFVPYQRFPVKALYLENTPLSRSSQAFLEVLTNTMINRGR